MRRVLLATATLLASALAGCALPEEAGEPAPDEEAPIVLAVEASRDAIRPGEAVFVNATATHVGDEPVVLVPGGCDQVWSMRVLHEGQREVDPELPEDGCGAVEGPESIEPGESYRAAFAWSGFVFANDDAAPAPPGRYELRVEFRYTLPETEQPRAAIATTEVVVVAEDEGA